MNSQSSSAQYWKTKGNQAFFQNKYQQAIDYYTKAIDQNINGSIYYSNRAKCHLELKNFDNALIDAQSACQLDDLNIKAHYMCGCIFAELAKNDNNKILQAEQKFKKALRLCDSLKKYQFAKKIEIKLKRLKKLQYFKQQQIKKNHNIQISNLIKLSTQNGLINKTQQQTMLDMQTRYRTPKPKQIPDYMLCKITLQLMQQPVTTQAGFSYEKYALQGHFYSNGATDPMTRLPLHGKIYPNKALKQAIEQFLVKNPWAFQQESGESYQDINF